MSDIIVCLKHTTSQVLSTNTRLTPLMERQWPTGKALSVSSLEHKTQQGTPTLIKAAYL